MLRELLRIKAVLVLNAWSDQENCIDDLCDLTHFENPLEQFLAEACELPVPHMHDYQAPAELRISLENKGLLERIANKAFLFSTFLFSSLTGVVWFSTRCAVIEAPFIRNILL
jgi:hypothetical protein